MTWKGFLIESKSFMGYPSNDEGRFAEWNKQLYFADGSADPLYPGWTEKERRAAKLKFWKAFPLAWGKFHLVWLRDIRLRHTRRVTMAIKRNWKAAGVLKFWGKRS